MSVDFASSLTKENLMRAFAGESQARNRYTFSASEAAKQGLYVVEAVFKFTAAQEKEHASVFYNHLRSLEGENIRIDGGYPVDISNSVARLLNYAAHNEFEEHDVVYKSFGETAKKEGFDKIAFDFEGIARVEKTHGERFKRLAELLEKGKLFVSDAECKWVCLNCGYVYEGTSAPEKCPVCLHDKGYFLRLELGETGGEILPALFGKE